MISDSDSNEVTSAHVDYTAKLPLDQKVYFQYYVQDDTDDGVLMNTKIKVKEVICSVINLVTFKTRFQFFDINILNKTLI